MQDPADSIAELGSRWTNLSDIERTLAVAAIRNSGISIRKIAGGLPCSEAFLRHLLLGLEASSEDQDLARRGQISTNELTRRGRAAKRRRAKQRSVELEAQRVKATSKGSDSICNWMINEQIGSADGEQIIEEVRYEFYVRERDGSLPPFPQYAALPLKELILRSKPKRPLDEKAASINWYKEWLCRWTFFAFKDPLVRDRALEHALERQWKRR